uniref:THAP-type domain-containing protein n=1 Tax=Sparus aurata TaxID=8175 RepID=A0A671YG38_SPAAU
HPTDILFGTIEISYFHRFPVDPEVRAQWLIKIRRDNFSPTQNTRLCSRHFPAGDFAVTAGGERRERRRVNKGAVPSLFAWNDYSIPPPRLNVWDRRPRCRSPGIASSQPLSDSDSEMEVQVANEHDYCLASENEALKKKVQVLQNQLETLQLQSRFGLQRLAGSDEDIRFYTRLVIVFWINIKLTCVSVREVGSVLPMLPLPTAMKMNVMINTRQVRFNWSLLY